MSMPIKERILLELEKEPLTNKELSKKLGAAESTIRSMIARLKKEGWVETVKYRENGGNNPYHVYGLKKHTDHGDLAFLMQFFQKNAQVLAKHSPKFLREHGKRFEQIAQKLNGGLKKNE